MIKIPKVFVITGTPGTGKTTVSRILSKKLKADHIELSSYAKENGHILDEDEERDTSVVDMESLSESLIREIEDKKTVIIDGHFGQDLFDPERVEMVVILRKQPWDLKPVLEERGYSSEKVWENLEAEIMGVITFQLTETYPPEKLVEGDTSGRTPKETAEEIITIINEGSIDEFDPIDWVTHPETMRVLLSRPCTLS